MTEAFYSGRIAGGRVGELAPVVAAAARDGDAVAIGLVDDIADEIAAFATASIRRLGLEGEAVPVTTAGGLARGAADLLVPRVTALVREVAPRAEVSVLHAPPVLGAALLGLDRLAPGDHAAADRLRAEIAAWDAAEPAVVPDRSCLVTVSQGSDGAVAPDRGHDPYELAVIVNFGSQYTTASAIGGVSVANGRRLTICQDQRTERASGRRQTRSLSMRRTPSIRTAVDSSAPASAMVASSSRDSGSATDT